MGPQPNKQTDAVKSPPASGAMLLKTDLTGHKLVHVPGAELSPELAWLVLDDNLISQIGNETLPA